MSNQTIRFPNLTKEQLTAFKSDLQSALVEVATKHNIGALSNSAGHNLYTAIDAAIDKEWLKNKHH